MYEGRMEGHGGKGAVCISGLPRFPQGYDSLLELKTYLESCNPDTQFDWYFYLWDVPNDNKEWHKWLIETFNPTQLKIAPLPTFNTEDNKKAFKEIERRRSNNKVIGENIYCMFKGIYECNKLIEGNYDVVIRSRVDLIYAQAGLYLAQYCFHPSFSNGGHLVLANNTEQWAYKGSVVGVEHAYNDQFAIGNPNIMNKYAECFNLLDHIILAETGNSIPISGERILYTHLQNQEVTVQLVPIFTFYNIRR